MNFRLALKIDPENFEALRRFSAFLLGRRQYAAEDLGHLCLLDADACLVGNRPLPAYEAEKITTENYAERFLAPAGMTGLWQVSKRGNDNMSYDERMDLDIEYARTRSTAMDIKLVYKTLTGAFLQKENV